MQGLILINTLATIAHNNTVTVTEEYLAAWAHSNVFNFLAQHAREGFLTETYMSDGGLTGCLWQQ